MASGVPAAFPSGVDKMSRFMTHYAAIGDCDPDRSRLCLGILGDS